jgi:lipoprotein-releasing system permease protein
MMHFSIRLALHYLRGTQQEKSIATMVKISFFGIVIGTFCLALVSTIMRGFEQATYQTIQGCHAPLTMQAHGNQLAFDALEKVFQKDFPNINYSPSDIQYVMLQDHDETISNLVALKGIDPYKEAQTSHLEKKIMPSIGKQTSPSMVDSVKNNAVLMGHQLARMLKIKTGDHFTVYFVPDHEVGNRTITLEKAQLSVGGIFKTGIEEFDANLLICSLDQLKKLFPSSGITSISISPQQKVNEKELQETLKKRFNLPIYSWKDRYPALVAALTLETYASFIILTLIVLVASMSILSLLFMQITQKRGDIAILKTLGASALTLRSIFMIMGNSIAFCAALTGLALAYLVGWILQQYVSIELPDAYFVTHLPVALELPIFVTVFFVVLFISFFATWLPTRSIKHIKCADVLRFER